MTWLLAHLYGIVYGIAIIGGLLWWARSTRRPAASALRSRTPEEDAELARLQARLRHLQSARETEMR